MDVRNDHPAMTEIVGGTTLGGAETEAGERTFLIADIRGYTRFTRENGDAAAARCAREGGSWLCFIRDPDGYSTTLS